MPPQAAERHYQQQARLAGLASTQAAQAWEAGTVTPLARTVTVLQFTAASDADPYLNTFDTDTAGRVNPTAFAGVAGDGRSVLTLFQQAESQALLQVMAATAVQDAGRAAVSAGITARPRLTGYVRMLTSPSCSRCAVLAGKWFKWNAGFQRHPRCDCRHIPAAEEDAGDLTTDPVAALRAGQIRGLSEADTKAILRDGADMGRVVNAGRTTDRAQGTVPPGGRLMPDRIYGLAGDDRTEAIRLLTQAGFIT